MAASLDPRLAQSTAEIAERIRFARPSDALGKVIFLIGAGCSISAGIPGAVKIAQRMAEAVCAVFDAGLPKGDPVAAYRFLVDNHLLTSSLLGDPNATPTPDNIDWYKVYDEMFRRHYKTPDDVRELFSLLVDECAGAVNWAHLCLGELVTHRYVSTVLTTNFDQLVLSGMVHAGVIPVVCDGIESLNRIAGAPSHPQLVELHGSRHTYLLRNAPEDVEAVLHDHEASAAIQKLFQNATTFVAVGYGGRERGVMDLLIRAAEVFPDKNLFWVSHSPDPKTISDKAQHFLLSSRNGRLLPGQDADRFFLELLKGLAIGPPRAVSQPLGAVQSVIAKLSKATMTDRDILAEVAAGRSRFERLSELDARATSEDPVSDLASKIREHRLAGDAQQAYRLANKAIRE